MIKKSEKNRIGKKFTVGEEEFETVGLQYYTPNGTWLGYEEFHAYPNMSPIDIRNCVENKRNVGKLPGLREGFKQVVIVVMVKGYSNQLIPLSE